MKRYRITNDLIANYLCFYCEGKPTIWNWFFGWRGGHWDTKGNLIYCEYIVPDKILNQAITLAKRFEKQGLTNKPYCVILNVSKERN